MDRLKTFRTKGVSLDDIAWIGMTGNDLQESFSDEGDFVVRRYTSGSDDYAEVYLKKSGRYVRMLDARHNLSATTSPTAVNDASQGYSIGSIWIDTINRIGHICVDSTVTSAVWSEMGGTGGGTTVSKATTFMRYQRRWGATAVDLSNIANSQNFLYDSANQPSWLAAGYQNDLLNYLGVFQNPHSISKVSVSMWMSQFQNLTGTTIANGSEITIEARIYKMLYNGYALVGTIPVVFTMANLQTSILHNTSSNRNTDAQFAVAVANIDTIPAGALLGMSLYCANYNFRPIQDFVVGVNFSE